MRIANRWPDPHCAKKVGTWSSTPGAVTFTQAGSYWRCTLPKGSALIPRRVADCMMMRLSPSSSLDSFRVERATALLREDGTIVMDTTPEASRDIVGVSAKADVETTVTGMCAVSLDEWPILRETGTLILAADSAPY